MTATRRGAGIFPALVVVTAVALARLIALIPSRLFPGRSLQDAFNGLASAVSPPAPDRLVTTRLDELGPRGAELIRELEALYEKE